MYAVSSKLTKPSAHHVSGLPISSPCSRKILGLITGRRGLVWVWLRFATTRESERSGPSLFVILWLLATVKIFFKVHCTSLTIPRFGSCDVKTTSAHSERHYPKDLILHLQGGDFKQPSTFVYSSKATEFFWNSRRLEHGAWTTISANECIDNEVVHLVL